MTSFEFIELLDQLVQSDNKITAALWKRDAGITHRDVTEFFAEIKIGEHRIGEAVSEGIDEDLFWKAIANAMMQLPALANEKSFASQFSKAALGA